MQMGEMVRNLPPQAQQTFKWDAYASQLVTALGFDSRQWVKTAEELKKEQNEMAQQQAQMQTQQGTTQAVGQSMAKAAGTAAETALQTPEAQAQAMQILQRGMGGGQ